MALVCQPGAAPPPNRGKAYWLEETKAAFKRRYQELTVRT
jgi:hypothetical protein